MPFNNHCLITVTVIFNKLDMNLLKLKCFSLTMARDTSKPYMPDTDTSVVPYIKYRSRILFCRRRSEGEVRRSEEK